ncbi:MAG: cryptochrome/photolyase family protein [Allorhizobium sp.]
MTKPDNSPILLWFRRDLRLADNAALSSAVASGRPVIPIYIRETPDAGSGPLGAAQAWWLHHSLTALAAALGAAGSRLVLISGDAGAVLDRLILETGATAIHWNRRYDPRGIAVDGALKQRLSATGLTVSSFAGQLLHEPSRLRTKTGGPYRVYTPFWRALEASGDPPEPFDAPAAIAAPADFPQSESLEDWKLLPTAPNWAREFPDLWTPGEAGALERLADFIEADLDGYKDNRDSPAKSATSMLSAHLALGEIAPSRIWHATRGLGDDINPADIIHFRKELVWRDFSYHLLFHFPKLAEANWNPRFDTFPWRSEPEMFARWSEGKTGYPIVDAGMRQLWRHGIMHNRVRMIAASFLIKHLLIDWREGERWFRDTLVDADPASNAASWQWVAGSGADASPFFRIFNPVLQGEKFDPDGDYIHEFVPELKGLGPKFVHHPYDAPADILEKAGVVLGETYPHPVVALGFGRGRALAAFKALPASV